MHWVHENYWQPGPQGNDIQKTNVPNLRMRFRFDNHQEEVRRSAGPPDAMQVLRRLSLALCCKHFCLTGVRGNLLEVAVLGWPESDGLCRDDSLMLLPQDCLFSVCSLNLQRPMVHALPLFELSGLEHMQAHMVYAALSLDLCKPSLCAMQMQLISAGSAAHAYRQEQQANARKESA